MVERVRVSAVSYLNTRPFLYGLEHSGFVRQIDLSVDYPANCAEKLIRREADVGLMPVAALPSVSKGQIITDYCIGCTGSVGSVLLLSQVPLERIAKILLDYQSRTSVELMKILTADYWKITPGWEHAGIGFENGIHGTTAGLVIGDRTFALKERYNYCYDLGEAWLNYTGLPFVFACWVANKPLPNDWTGDFNEALATGIRNIDRVIQNIQNEGAHSVDPEIYLKKNISFQLNDEKRMGLELFLKKTFEQKNV